MIRTRFAPSPTGYLHIGNLRNALFSYLIAKKDSGEFLLRIEDTDQKRFVPDSIIRMLKTLYWVGIVPDKGVKLKQDNKGIYSVVQEGPDKSYTQSERLDIYKKHIDTLINEGHAYYCFCVHERLDEIRKSQQLNMLPTGYDKHCRMINPIDAKKRVAAGESYTIRLKMPESGETILNDIVRGTLSFKNELIDDQVLIKSDGYPTYHFAAVIDDHLMGVSHVIRGEEWLSSTPKHLQLYKYFGWNPPNFAHLPLILNADRSKMSKRQGDVSAEDYIKKGYLKEAIINFVALLGWNPGSGSTQEIFTIHELIQQFDFSHVHKGGAVFDVKKLDWINSEWIKKIDFNDLYFRAREFYLAKDFIKNASEDKKTADYLKKILHIERDRLSKLDEVGEKNIFFFRQIEYNKNLLCWKKASAEDTKNSLQKSLDILMNIEESDWTKENLEVILLKVAGNKRGNLLWPLRAALTGEQKSPSPFEVAWGLGKKESLERIKNALMKL